MLKGVYVLTFCTFIENQPQIRSIKMLIYFASPQSLSPLLLVSFLGSSSNYSNWEYSRVFILTSNVHDFLICKQFTYCTSSNIIIQPYLNWVVPVIIYVCYSPCANRFTTTVLLSSFLPILLNTFYSTS